MEKRRHPRVEINLPVTVRHKGKLIPATAVNVSCGGMYLVTEGGALSEDSSVEVTFDLNGETRDVSLCGVVSRVEGTERPHVGVQFGSFFSAGHKALREFLRKHLS
jgi:hypothetical protein